MHLVWLERLGVFKGVLYLEWCVSQCLAESKKGQYKSLFLIKLSVYCSVHPE